MSAASPASSPSSAASHDASNALGRIIDLTSRLATSWVGLLTAYAGAVSAAVIAFQQLNKHLNEWPLWARILLVAALPFLVLISHTIPTLVEQCRKKRLGEITGNLRAGYFRLVAREDQATFTRADGKHDEVLEWLEQPPSPLLYLTGQSGSGKSSLLAAWAIPHLKRKSFQVLRLRGYQDPLAALQQELLKPGVIWQKPPSDGGDLRSLLERAARYVRPNRLLVVLDQFEEFVILQGAQSQQRFEQFVAPLQQNPVPDLSFLFVFRSDYIGLVEKLSLPPLTQNTNWKEVPPFTEIAAREFMQGSGLQFNDKLMAEVLREAAEIEQTKGLVRPVTINLCGLVLGRFANGLPRGFRSGGLIRAFLRESVLLPSVRDVAPRLLPHLISSYVTKRPRTITDLAKDTALDPATVRGCLRVLGQDDRAIVRPLDEAQQSWEISHDFLVPMLDSILARWTVSLWRKTRPWLPWLAATAMAIGAIAASRVKPDARELYSLGWTIEANEKGVIATVRDPEKVSSLEPLAGLDFDELHISGPEIKSLEPLKGFTKLSKLEINGTQVADLSPLANLRGLTELRLVSTQVADLTPLQGLTKLGTLIIYGDKVKDLRPLQKLTSLRFLELSGKDMHDLEPLSSLTTLSTLGISGSISTLEPLHTLTNLSTLKLGASDISNLHGLEDLNNLDWLVIYHSPHLDNLEGLTGKLKLKTLYFDAPLVTDLKPLEGLTNLQLLGLHGSQVTSLKPIENLGSLTSLHLEAPLISDLRPLQKLEKLEQLIIKKTRVTDLKPLTALHALRELTIEETPVSDLKPLKGLHRLTELKLIKTEASYAAEKDLEQALPRLNISRY